MSGKSISVIHLNEMWLLRNRTVYEASVYISCRWTYPAVSFQTTLCCVDVVSNSNCSLSAVNFQQNESSDNFFFAIFLSYLALSVVSGYFHTLPDALSLSLSLSLSLESKRRFYDVTGRKGCRSYRSYCVLLQYEGS